MKGSILGFMGVLIFYYYEVRVCNVKNVFNIDETVRNVL